MRTTIERIVCVVALAAGVSMMAVGAHAEPGGAALSFDGTDDYAVTESAVNVGNTFTIEFWAKPDVLKNFGDLLSADLVTDKTLTFVTYESGATRLFAYYVDPSTTTMQQRAHVELATTGTVAFGYVAQTFADVDFVDRDTLAVSESWTQGGLFPPAPEPDWGGIHFYRIDYPDGGPATPNNAGRRIGFSFAGELVCLRGYQVDALATSGDGWVTARIHWKEGLVRKRRTILFDYADVARLNGLANNVALAEIMMPLTSFAPTIAEMGVRSACFRHDGRLVIPVGCEQRDGTGKTGVYVFDRSTKAQVHYYPGGRCGSAFYDPQHFAYYPDSNVQLVPAPTAAFPANSGDVFVGTQWAGQIARLGRRNNSTTPPTLENAYVRLDFSGANYALTNIVDKTAGAELNFGTNAPLWQLLLLDRSALSGQVIWAQHFADVWATDTSAAPTRNHYLEDTGPEQILHLDWTDVPLPYGGTATVNAEVHLPDGSAESVWTIAVDTTGPTDALWRVTFPLVLLKPIRGDSRDDIAAVPIRSGLLVPNPHTNKVAGFSPYDAPLRYGPSEIAPDANDIFRSALGGVHPGRWEMQWMHVYDDGSHNGLFLRSTDTNGYVKALTLCPVYQASPIGTLLHWQHYPEDNTAAARDYTPPYDVRLRPMSGDWFDAARLYRSWLTSQVWCAKGPLIDNPDFPHPETNGLSVGVGMTVKCGGADATFPSVGAMIDACEEWETFFGVEGGMGFLREWGWPVTDPYFRPFFTNAVAELNANGWSVLPYTGSWLWNTNAGDDAAGTLAASAGTTLNGEWNTEERWHATTMCPAAAKWRDKYVSLSDDLQALGCTHQYCDLYPIARLCYATNHNHAAGGGNYWIEGYRTMVAEAGAHSRSNHADAGWMPEHRSEFGLDLFDHYWVQYWTYLEEVFKGFVPAGVPVPIIAATAHDYIGCTSSAGEEHADFVNAGGTPDGRLPWRFVQAWSFVNGNTMSHGVSGSPSAALSSPATRPDFLYLKELKHHRAAALDFLLYGEFLRPPDTGSGTVGIPLWRHDYAQPRILGGAFRARGGSVGVFMTNYDPAAIRTADYTIRRADYGLTNGTYAIRSVTPDGEAHYGGFRTTDYLRKWQFAPGSILMLEIAAVADAEADGMGDAWASTNGVSDPNADSDSDGLSNRLEFQSGTDPNSADTDGDGDSDAAEVARGTDPRDASSYSFLVTGIASAPSNAVIVAWRNFGTNYRYTVDIRTSLLHGAWTSGPGTWPSPATNWTSGTITSAIPHFYRVRAVLPLEE